MNQKWPPALCELLRKCWHEDKNSRPTMAEVEAELQVLLQQEKDRCQVRAGSLGSRLEQWLTCRKGDLTQDAAKRRRVMLGLCARILISIASVAMLIASFSIAFETPQPTSPSPTSSSESSGNANASIALSTVAIIGLYSCLFSHLRVWPLIPQEMDSIESLEELHGSEQLASSPFSPRRSSLGLSRAGTGPGTGSLSGSTSVIKALGNISGEKTAKNSQYHSNAEGAESLGALDVNASVLDGLSGLDYPSDVEFFDTINIDDSHGKGHGSTNSFLNGSLSYNSMGVETGSTSNNNSSDVAAVLFPSFKGSGGGTYLNNSAGKRSSRSNGNSSEDYSPSFNPMMAPTFV